METMQLPKGTVRSGVATGNIIDWDGIDFGCSWNVDFYSALHDATTEKERDAIFDDAEAYDEANPLIAYGQYVATHDDQLEIGALISPDDYCMLHDTNQNDIEIQRSHYVIRCELTWMHNAGWIENDGEFYAYCLPPSALREEWYVANKDRIFKLSEV